MVARSQEEELARNQSRTTNQTNVQPIVQLVQANDNNDNVILRKVQTNVTTIIRKSQLARGSLFRTTAEFQTF